jgi:hypothetical protein
MQKYLLSISTENTAKIDSFLSKKQAFKAFIKAKKALFYGNIKNIALIKSKTINNTIHNKTLINL